MPRPTDYYTHSQFEPVESDSIGETVQCVHCRAWTGSVKTLNRKKEHLHKCAAYARWRADGNGQDVPAPNKYTSVKRNSSAINGEADTYISPYTNTHDTSIMTRGKVLDIGGHFDEFFDGTSEQKCIRCRCRYCGFVRAKNSTRQSEHLLQCADFLNSAEGQRAVADGSFALQKTPTSTSASQGHRDVFRGGAPNTNLGPARPRMSAQHGDARVKPTPTRAVTAPSEPAPSLVNHLITKSRSAIEEATRVPFLSHAGSGSLSSEALRQWLPQQAHLSRALCSFIGSLISKIRLPDTANPHLDSSWRALDLLVSTINNAKRELEFLRSTQAKHGLQSEGEPTHPATKGLIGLLGNAASPAASLMEGLVVLWAVEYLYCISWQHARTFLRPLASSSTSYTLPSYLNNSGSGSNYNSMLRPDGSTIGQNPNNNNNTPHITALHEALIPNWTSQGFTNFVDACKAIVDELANAQTTGNGAVELGNCEENFRQVLWLWRQTWPEVVETGERRVDVEARVAMEGPESGNANENAEEVVVVPDEEERGDGDGDGDAAEEEEEEDESLYGGTGLEAVAAANRAG